MEERKFYFENKNGDTLRSIQIESDHGVVIQRKDNGRICFVSDTKEFSAQGIDFITLQEIDSGTMAQETIELQGIGRLRLADDKTQFIASSGDKEESQKALWLSTFLLLSCLLIFVGKVLFIPEDVKNKQEEKKKHIVKIFKPIPKVKQTTSAANNFSMNKTKVEQKTRKRSVKRMGALAVLGSSKHAKTRGGVNLGAVKTSRGPGLGGTKGSGGVQTSLYGKGIVAAPVGPGANIKGAGGYGTKGKGGGQAGYGSLSLVGSSGTSSIPLGREALVQGGLDRDLIAAVIAKNMGQVRFCYEQGLQLDPKISGRVGVQFVIGASGSVTTAKIASSSLKSSIVENCIVMRLKTWKFPKPEGGVNVNVKYPFLLKRVGQG